MQNKKWKTHYLLFTFLLLLFFAPWSKQIDLSITRSFFSNGSFSESPIYSFIYTYGVWPSWILLLTGLIAWRIDKKWKKPFLYLFFTLLVGSGLIIHLALKEHWGRPRPKQVIEFGGLQEFRPFYSPQFSPSPEPSKSFSCGHCSVGFYFFSLFFIGRFFQSKRMEIAGLFLAFSLGFLLSLTRIAQGGHFFSDTVVSALIMWFTSYFLSFIFLKKETEIR